MEITKKNYGPMIALIALITMVALMTAAWLLTRPDTNAGSKFLTVEVVHGDGSTKKFDIRTDAEYLRQALLEHEEIGIVGEDGQFGLYILEVDSEAASDAERTYWAISLNGEDLMVGADGQPVADGEHYELTLTKW